MKTLLAVLAFWVILTSNTDGSIIADYLRGPYPPSWPGYRACWQQAQYDNDWRDRPSGTHFVCRGRP